MRHCSLLSDHIVLHHLQACIAQDAANASSTMVYDVTTVTSTSKLVRGRRPRPRDAAAGPAVDRRGRHPAARVAADLGLPATCAVVVGTGDEHAASVGAGAIESGVVVDVTGPRNR